MSHTSLILTGLMMMAMLVFIAPNIFALNRGHILRNIALWLAIFFALALFYQNFGPDSTHPLFQMPKSMANMNRETPALKLPEAAAPKDTKKDEDKNTDDTGEQGFTPPKE